MKKSSKTTHKNAAVGGFMGDPEITGEHEVDLGLLLELVDGQRQRLIDDFQAFDGLVEGLANLFARALRLRLRLGCRGGQKRRGRQDEAQNGGQRGHAV